VGAPGTNIMSTWAGSGGLLMDSLTEGWTRTTTTSGGWSYGSLKLEGGYSYPFLLDPGTYPGGSYNNGTDDRVYKTFDLAGADVAVVSTWAATNVAYGDHFRVGYRAGGGDPFAGGTIVADVTNAATYPYLMLGVHDVSGGIGSSCTVGFQLQSDAAGTALGVALMGFSIETLTLNRTSYSVIDGTSMATPGVAGLAAMLLAYNPQFTCADVVNAIRQGGRAVTALAGKTTTGRAVDVMSSLSYIKPPTGLTATVE
jgi:thermitase